MVVSALLKMFRVKNLIPDANKLDSKKSDLNKFDEFDELLSKRVIFPMTNEEDVYMRE